MDKNEKVTETQSVAEDFVLRFSKPYMFEGKEYLEVDLSAMDSLSISDMNDIERRMKRGFEASTNFMPEMTLEYACHFAAKAAKLPVEFFENLPAREGMNLRGIVSNFFF